MKNNTPLLTHCLIILIIFTHIPTFCPDVLKNEKKDEKEINFEETMYSWIRTFAHVMQLTEDKHYKISNPEQCMIKSIDEFLTCLDPHSSFLDQKTYKAIMESTTGEFFGIGIVIDNTRQSKDKFLTIVDTIPDGPSDKIGILPYDKIIEIDGHILEGMTTEEATAKLKGERNTKVHVKILREGKTDPLSFDITRDVIKEQSSLCFYLPEQNIYYVSLTSFTDNAMRQIKELLQKSSKQGYKGLVLDLRNNSGGLLSAAIDIAGLFLDKGSFVVATKDKYGKETERYVTTTDPIAHNGLPIFILINNFTASAAEILAGCLQIHSQEVAKKGGNKSKKLMVFVVGSKSFGKGSVQEVIPIGNDCAVKLTTSLYFLPNNTSVQGTGIEPDFMIDRQFPAPEQVVWFNKYYGQECALPNYIKVHETTKEDEKQEKKTEEKEKKKTWSERARTALNSDNQFRAAITLINLFDYAKHNTPKMVETRTHALQFMQSIYVTKSEFAMEEIK